MEGDFGAMARRCGTPPGRHFISGRAEGAKPFAEPRAAAANHDQRVRPTGDEHIEDLGESEQLGAYVVHPVAAL